MARTIVISDLHGSVATLTRALEHAGAQAEDRIVIAGDLVDVGAEDTIAAAERVGALILAGNHEVAAALGVRIVPQSNESLRRGPEYLQRFASGEWPLAVERDGWLISHAGVSAVFGDVISRAGSDPTALADEINALFRAEATDALGRVPLQVGDLERYRVMGGELGPLWFRPDRLDLIPSGLRQIVGHTPPDVFGVAHRAALASRGWLLVEPGGHDGGPETRYALIENGEATVVEV